MASKTTLTLKNLEALGPERLAALLMEISAGNANAKRRLRMELAGVESPSKLSHEISKRLTSIGNATTTVGWRSLKAFKADLDSLRKLIAEQLADASPNDALDLMWSFIGLSPSVLERTSDSSGEIIGIFRQAGDDIPAIATRATIPLPDLADKVFEAVLRNTYGQFDGLIPSLSSLLGAEGLSRLRTRLAAAAKEPDSKISIPTRKMSKWRRGRKSIQDQVVRRSRQQMIHLALLAVADASGDVDAYMALQPDIRQSPMAAAVAERLLKAGRAAEALDVLDRVKTSPNTRPAPAWQAARIEALEALGRTDDAQTFRLDVFHKTLSRDVLKAYLKRLPDFDDIEAEDAALDFVLTFPEANQALAFLMAWPAVDRAAGLITTRLGEITSDDIFPAAIEKLAARYPLAATLLLRKLINAILSGYRSADYATAADYLGESQRLSARIEYYGDFDSHDTYVEKLRAGHGRKSDFWNAVA